MIKQQHKDKKASLSLLENCPVRNYLQARCLDKTLMS